MRANEVEEEDELGGNDEEYEDEEEMNMENDDK